MNLLRVILMIGACLVVPAALTGSLAAQGEVDITEAGSSDGSFAGAFFIARSTSPDGQVSIEWLGSILIWFLLLLSAFNIGYIGMMLATNQRKAVYPDAFARQVEKLLSGRRYREAIELTGRQGSDYARIMHAALQQASSGFGAMVMAMQQATEETATQRLRSVEHLNLIGQVSPMIGLFGTVYGMIVAFGAIASSGGNADPVLLAGGIGTALVTTFWGLLVAIPALAAYAFTRNKIDGLVSEAAGACEKSLARFMPAEGREDQAAEETAT
ncbi:MAG: hypothetical protein CMJ32_11150 [Phycisphaerae bacterium]|nr:hypothetical protein [Phycisphaerae bacterium]